MINCEKILEAIGASCTKENGGYIISLPIQSLSGSHNAVMYIEELSNSRYRITDYGDTAFSIDTLQVPLKKENLEKARKFTGTIDVIKDNWRSEVVVNESDLASGVWDVISGITAIYTIETIFEPKIKKENEFISELKIILQRQAVKDELMLNHNVVGFSGHTEKIPFVVKSEGTTKYIDAISTTEKAYPWEKVRQITAKMLDLKTNNNSYEETIVILDDINMQRSAVEQATMLLAQSSSILKYSEKDQWLKDIAA